MLFDKRFILLFGVFLFGISICSVSAQGFDANTSKESFNVNPGVLVVKPDHNGRFDSYSLTEWMFTSIGWSFTSYDNVVFQPAPHGQNWQGTRGIDVYINGMQLQTNWLQHSYLHMLEFSPEIIDSVVAYPPGSFVRNRMSLAGAIDIYLRDDYLVRATGNVANQENDFGPINQEGVRDNVERVLQTLEVSGNLHVGRYRTQIMANISDFSYSNKIFYDKEVRPDFVRRRPLEIPGNWGYQTPLSLLQTHQFESSSAVYQAMTSLSYFTHYFLWDDWTGNEISGRHRLYNVAASRQAKTTNGLFLGVSYALANTKPVREDNDFNYDLNQHGFKLNALYSYRLPNHSTVAVGFVSDLKMYEDLAVGETLESNLNHATVSYRQRQFQADAALGRNYSGASVLWSRNNVFSIFNYQHDTTQRLAEVMPRLDTGFGIRGTNNTATMHVLDRPEMQFISQVVGYAGNTSSIQEYRFTLNYTWFLKLPHRETQFRHPEPGIIGYPLVTRFAYRTIEGVGQVQLSGLVRKKWGELASATQFNLTAYTWGDALYQVGVSRYPDLVFSQYLRYKLHPTFTIHASYHYEGERTFAEFISTDASIELWPPPDTRAFHNISLGFEQTLAGERVSLSFILRNLLSNTETYHPNGLY
ncbi:MAG: hypothetical protein LAT52_07630, partial [Balneolales bacterium]|nr:hypothetical protein [Balneolales bacterium]